MEPGIFDQMSKPLNLIPSVLSVSYMAASRWEDPGKGWTITNLDTKKTLGTKLHNYIYLRHGARRALQARVLWRHECVPWPSLKARAWRAQHAPLK